MVVLADELLEQFFESDLRESFRLQSVEIEDVSHHGQPTGFLGLGGLLSTIVTEDNKKIFNRFTDEIGKTIGKHQVMHRPSIGRIDRKVALEEPKARESLLPPTPRLHVSLPRSPSPAGSFSGKEKEKQGLLGAPSPLTPTPSSPVINPIKFAVLERTPFAIDEAREDGESDDEDTSAAGGEDDAEVMDEVRG